MYNSIQTLMELKKFWCRTLGLFGILGGFTLFAGDMLFYYDPINDNLHENIGDVSDLRIMISGVTALFGAWFYMLGIGQIYYAFRPTKPIIRNSVLICFGAISIAYGVIHSAYLAIATTTKLATQNNLNLNETVSLALETNNLLRLIVYPIFGILCLLFITQVWKRKTLYPRWILLFFPLIPFMMQDFICEHLSGTISIIVCGGYLNLILVVFYTASTVALWNGGKKLN